MIIGPEVTTYYAINALLYYPIIMSLFVFCLYCIFYCGECQTSYANEVNFEHCYNIISQRLHCRYIPKERNCYYYYFIFVFLYLTAMITLSPAANWVYLCIYFFSMPAVDYLARNCNIEVTMDCDIMVFCNGIDYSVTCSKLSLVYFVCQLADRPEQDLSFFLFLLILPEKLITDFRSMSLMFLFL